MPRARAALASLACALLLGTVACSSPEGDETPASSERPSASASDAPIFASDEEALAAAVEAYEAYAKASTVVANAGGEGADTITPLVGPEFDAVVQEEFAALRDSGLRLTGEAIHYNARHEKTENENGIALVTIVLCRDVSGTRLVRPDGSDVTPAERDLIQASRVELASRTGDSTDLIVVGAERQEDEQGC